MKFSFEKDIKSLSELIHMLENGDLTFFSMSINEDGHKETFIVGNKNEKTGMWHMTENDVVRKVVDNKKCSYILSKEAVWTKLNNILEMVEVPSISRHKYEVFFGLCF